MENKIIATSMFGSWIQIAQQQNIYVAPILENLQISNNDTFIPFEQFSTCIEWIINESKNDVLGLQVGKQSNLAALGIVGQLIQSSKTIKEGIEKCCEMFNLISNVLQLDCQITSEHCILTFAIDKDCLEKHPVVCQQLLIASMVFSCKEISFLTLKQYLPLSAQTTFEYRKNSTFETILNTSIKPNSDQNRIVFNKNIINEQIVYADYELFIHLEKLACQRLTQQIQHLEKFSDTVKSIVYSLLEPHFPSLSDIAHQVNMSERTVQRKLKEEGLSYSQLIIEMKKSIALDYLSKQLTVKEISYLLGYSEPSAFVYAFKNWFGKSPLKYFRNL